MASCRRIWSPTICDLTTPRRVILGSRIGIAPADGETIGRRIRINQPDDENARCKVSRASVQHRDFSPFTQQPTTPSTFNAISFQHGRTELFEPRPWTHGVRPLLQHEHDRQRDHSRLSFHNVTKPAPRIHAELLKLGIEIGQTSVANCTISGALGGGGGQLLGALIPALASAATGDDFDIATVLRQGAGSLASPRNLPLSTGMGRKTACCGNDLGSWGV